MKKQSKLRDAIDRAWEKDEFSVSFSSFKAGFLEGAIYAYDFMERERSKLYGPLQKRSGSDKNSRRRKST